MYPLVLTTQPVVYRLHDIGETDRPYEQGGLLIQYNDELHATDYQERINKISGIWVGENPAAPSGREIRLLCWLDTVRWPSWASATFTFDAESGAYLGRADATLSIWDYEMNITPQGELFTFTHWNNIKGLDANSYESTGENYVGSYWHDGGDDGIQQTNAWMFDRLADRAVIVVNPITGSSMVSVFQWSTGDLLHQVAVAGKPLSIYFENREVCHVVATNGVVTVVNYVTGKVMGVGRHTPDPTRRAGFTTQYSYDGQLKRILVADMMPDDVNGACQIVVKGYRPSPIPVMLTVPIPTSVPRLNTVVPVISRAVGDAAESIGGISVSQTITGDGTLTPAVRQTGPSGYAEFQSTSAVTGSQAPTVTAEV